MNTLPTKISLPSGGIGTNLYPSRPVLKELLFGSLGIVGVTILLLLLKPLIGYRAVGVVYLLAISLSALKLSWKSVLLISIVSGFLWNFLFIPPLHTFTIDHYDDWLMLGAMVLAGGIIGTLTSRLRHNEVLLQKQKDRMASLYHFTQVISSSFGLNNLVENGIANISKEFNSLTAIQFGKSGEERNLELHPANTMKLDGEEKEIADWVVESGSPAGQGTGAYSSSGGFYLPLQTSQDTIGVLGIFPKDQRDFTTEEKNHLKNFSYQLALGMERELLNESLQEKRLFEESQKIFQTLLNSISHELKTPLAAIEGSASALTDIMVQKSPAAFNNLIQEINEGSERMKTVIQNLLDMNRIEAQRLQLKLEPTDMGDLISIVLKRSEKFLKRHELKVEIPQTLDLINVDFVLMEQAIRNILHNAVIYSPCKSEIKIRVEQTRQNIKIIIEDKGPGLPQKNPERIFEKFFRFSPKIAGGTGLGLTISKAFVELHGGRLAGMNRSSGGAQFIIELPAFKEEGEAFGTDHGI